MTDVGGLPGDGREQATAGEAGDPAAASKRTLVVAGVLGVVAVLLTVVGVVAFIGSSSPRDDADRLELERKDLREVVDAAGRLTERTEAYREALSDGDAAGGNATDVYNMVVAQFDTAIGLVNSGDAAGGGTMFEQEVGEAVEDLAAAYEELGKALAAESAALDALDAYLAESADD